MYKRAMVAGLIKGLVLALKGVPASGVQSWVKMGQLLPLRVQTSMFKYFLLIQNYKNAFHSISGLPGVDFNWILHVLLPNSDMYQPIVEFGTGLIAIF